MFRLGKQVGGNVGRTAAAVVDYQYLARTGNHVDADLSEYQLLGGGDIDVPGPGDLVNPRNCCRTVCQRRNGLRAADAEDAVDAGEVGGDKHMWAELAAGGGGHHDDFADARDAGRYGVHNDTARVA